MGTFKGFGEQENPIPIPDSFFDQVLAQVGSLDELKVILMALWVTARMEGPVRALRGSDFSPDEIGLTPAEIAAGLEKAASHGVLLTSGAGAAMRYFLNSPRGRAALSGLAAGGKLGETAMTGPLAQPNVFRLYEENIGPLTPLIADALKGAEQDYPEAWIAEAIELAVSNNKRSWAYCEAILKRWKEEGRAEKQNRRDHKAARQRDVEKKIRKFIED